MNWIKLGGVLSVSFFYFEKEQQDHKLHNFHLAGEDNINSYMCSERKSLGII